MHDANKLLNSPPINVIKDIQFPSIEHKILDGDIDMYTLLTKEPDIFQMDVVFDAGKWQEEKQLAASATAFLFKEGTENFSALEIAQRFEDCGAVFRATAGNDHIILSLYCLRRVALPLIEFLFLLLKEATFPEKEIELYRKRGIEGLKVDLANNDIVAHRTLTLSLFGEHHPYGYNSTEAHYESLTKKDLADHYATFSNSFQSVFISGHVDTNLMDQIEAHISNYRKMGITNRGQKRYSIKSSNKRVERISNRNGPQTSLRMGKILSDTQDLRKKSMRLMINTLLGGFFGSRLMTAIREERGYTYDINSYIERNKYGSYIGISTEVGNEYVKDTISEIHKQMNKLKEELVSIDELTMVKNYINGSILGSYNGVAKTMQSYRRYLLKGEKLEDINYFVEFIKTVTVEDIRADALELLNFDGHCTVMVD